MLAGSQMSLSIPEPQWRERLGGGREGPLEGPRDMWSD